MTTHKVRVRCCQMAPSIEDPSGNLVLMEQEIRRAAEAGVHLVIFPELAASGYSFADAAEARALAEPADGPLIAGWVRLAAELDIVVVAGYAELGADGQVFNSAVIVDTTGVRANYRKVHLWGREPEYFSAGAQPPAVVDTSLGRLGLVICYDLDFPEFVRAAALDGAELLCAPVNWPVFAVPEGQTPTEVVRAQASAGINQMAVAVCDRSGSDRGLEWLGGSTIVAADGYALTPLVVGERSSVTADIVPARSRSKRIGDYNDAFGDRRPELYGAVARRLS